MSGDREFYRAFEERHRGTREEILERLDVYRPWLEGLGDISERPRALDLGCGRGEWLEILSRMGIEAIGVDRDEGMLRACRERGLIVHEEDALEFLRQVPDGALTLLSAFHFVEHIPFPQLKVLITEAKRVLCKGGILILETPNPENIRVASELFYLDPTHDRPLPSALLAFLAEYEGFIRTQVLRLQESPELRERSRVTLLDVLGGVSPDYAVIAQKEYPASVALPRYDALFAGDYGLSIDELARRFEERLRYLEGRLDEVGSRNDAMWRHFIRIAGSAPVRGVKRGATEIRRGVAVLRKHFGGLFTPLPGRSELLGGIRRRVEASPRLRQGVRRILNRFPGLKLRLKQAIAREETLEVWQESGKNKEFPRYRRLRERLSEKEIYDLIDAELKERDGEES